MKALVTKEWSDVDEMLRRVAGLDIQKRKAEGAMTLEINKIKEKHKKQLAGISTQRKELSKAIETFCEQHKAEFAVKRSKELNFGKIGFRLVKSIALPRAKDKVLNLMENLKAYGLTSCIVLEEKLNKDEIVELEESQLVKLGLKKSVKDSFRIEPKIEEIEEA